MQTPLDLVKDYSQSDTSFLRQIYEEEMLGAPQAAADAAQMAQSLRGAGDASGTYACRREEASFARSTPTRALQLALES